MKNELTLSKLQETYNLFRIYPRGPNLLNISIIENEYMVIEKQRIIQRTWRERFFSWPWRPWQSERKEIWQAPNPSILFVDGIIYCHPVIARQIKTGLNL